MRAALLVLPLLLVVALAAPAQAKLDAAAGRALDYLEERAAGAGPLAANVAEAAHALGQDPSAWPPGDPLAARIEVPGPDASNISLLRPLRALALAGDARAADLEARVLSHRGESGYGDARTLNDDAYAVLALAAARPDDAGERFTPMLQALGAGRHPSGGWGWAVGGGPSTDMTGLVVEAYVAVEGGFHDEASPDALDFLATTADPRGGYAESPGGARNCESTVWGIRLSYRLTGNADPDDWDFLLGLQNEDGGFAHLPGGRSDLLCTTEVAGLLGEHVAPATGDRGIPALPPGLVLVALATLAIAMSTRLREP